MEHPLWVKLLSLPGGAARPSPAAAFAGSDGRRAARSLLMLLQAKQDRGRSCKCGRRRVAKEKDQNSSKWSPHMPSWALSGREAERLVAQAVFKYFTVHLQDVKI